jgi:hypothetical protein
MFLCGGDSGQACGRGSGVPQKIFTILLSGKGLKLKY